MGQANSTPTDSFDPTKRVRYQDFVNNYLFIRKVKDPRYGDISLLQDKLTRQHVALREIALNSSKDFERDRTALQVRSKISHPNIIRILGYTSKSEELIYASEHKILVIMEYIENDLEKEIQRRKPGNEFYKEEQLWYVLENTMKALLEFQRNNIVHGDIKTSSVLMSRMGVYKITQPSVKSSASPNTSRLLSDDNKPYLSPILLSNMQKNGTKGDHNPWKSDVFSLGMVLLHAATLNSSDKLYNWRDNGLNLSELEQTLSALKIMYSERLQNILRMMLSIHEDKRPDFIDLEKLVSVTQGVTKGEQPQQQPKQARHAPTLKFRVLEVPGSTSEAQPRQNESYKLEKKPKVEVKTILQDSNPNISKKFKDIKEAPLFKSEQKRVKSPEMIFQGETPSNYRENPRIKIHNENAMRVMTEPNHSPFLNKTSPKGKSNITHEYSPSPLRTLNFHTEGDDYDPTLGREIQSAAKKSIPFETKSPLASMNSPQPKSSVTSQYKSLISNEVAQLMADFESKMERNKSPGNTNISQNISRVQKENLEASRETGSLRSPNSQLLQNIVNGGPGSIKYAGSPIQFDKSAYASSQRSPNQTLLTDIKPTLASSSSANNLQREPIFQNPYFPGAPVSPVVQPRTIQMQVPTVNNANGFYMPGNYLTPQNKPRQILNLSQNTLNLTGSQRQENTAISFDSHFNTSINKTYNPPAADVNLSNSEQVPNQQLANSKSDPYLMFNRSNDQPVFEKPPGFSDSYETIQPKDSVKSTSSNSSGQLRSYLTGLNAEETVTEKLPDGSVYKGQKKNGLRHGKGTYHHSDGSMYSGGWFRGLMQGQGTLYYAGGSKAYQGQWREDKFEGKGVVFNEFPARLQTEFDFRNFDNVGEYWTQYEGDFMNDQKQGAGTLFLTNGERYQGNFREDLIEGVGVFYMRSGKAFKGEWYKNRLIRPL